MVLYAWATTGPRTTTTSISWTNPVSDSPPGGCPKASRGSPRCTHWSRSTLPARAKSSTHRIGIETDRGPWVSALVAAGYHVYAINPRSASRYRDRHHVGGAKSDAGDARLLADLVRTDRHNHREVAGDSDEAGGVRILARAHQQLIWDRVRQTNRLRNALREYFPGALEAFPELAHGDAVGVLSSGARPARGGAAEHLPDPLRAQARRPPAQPRAARRRGPRGVALPAARGACRGEQGVRREHRCGNEGARRDQPSDQGTRGGTGEPF